MVGPFTPFISGQNVVKSGDFCNEIRGFCFGTAFGGCLVLDSAIDDVMLGWFVLFFSSDGAPLNPRLAKRSVTSRLMPGLDTY